MTDVKAPDTGAFKLRLYSGEGWFVEGPDGKDIAGPYAEQKTAARKARQLSGKDMVATPEAELERPKDGSALEGEALKPATLDVPKAEAPAKRQQKAKPAEAPEGWTVAAPGPEQGVGEEPVIDDGEALPAGTIAKVATSQERHEWLELARLECARLLSMVDGFELPVKVRVSIGMPFGTRKAIGQCWHEEASSDGFREVFVSPTLDDGARICDVLLHELVHAGLPSDAKHGPAFKRIALAVGLTGKMTATVAGESLAEHFAAFVQEIGPYPAGSIDPNASGRKKQSTRLLKAECTENAGCGYTIRVTAKWANTGLPLCGNKECNNYGVPMTCEGYGEGEDEGGDE